MSFLAEAWADSQKPRRSSQLHLLRIIASHHRDEEGYAWPSNRYLADKTLSSEATVERNLTALEAQGYLRRETKLWGPNGGAKRHIFLNFDAEQVENDLRMKRTRHSKNRSGTAGNRSPQNEGTCGADLEPKRSPQDEGQVPSICGLGTLTGEGSESLGNPLGNSKPPKPPEDGGTSADRNQDSGEGDVAAPVVAPDQASTSARQERRPAGQRRAPVPALPPDVARRFRELMAVFPRQGTLRCRELDAQAAFAALSPAQQGVAIERAQTYAASFREKPGHVFALQTWLRQTDFTLPAGGTAVAPAASPQRVFVRADTPEWEAWQAHLRATTGKGSPQRDGPGGQGWSFPSLMPPASAVA